MAIGITHAVMSEHKDKYGSVGDQLQTSDTNDRKGEIRQADWYKRSGGWGVYLECTDPNLAKAATEWAVKIANSSHYGYSQGGGSSDGRWSGYKSIKSSGVDGGKGNFDCSSLVISCYVLAGCPNLKPTGYTGSMEKLLMATGKFKKYTDSAHVASASLARLGGVYIAPGAHTAIVTNAPVPTNSTSTQAPPITGKYVLVSGNVYVRKEPKTSAKALFIARQGNKLPYTGLTVKDGTESEWYQVDTDDGIGWISAFTKKQRKYTKLVPQSFK